MAGLIFLCTSISRVKSPSQVDAAILIESRSNPATIWLHLIFLPRHSRDDVIEIPHLAYYNTSCILKRVPVSYSNSPK